MKFLSLGLIWIFVLLHHCTNGLLRELLAKIVPLPECMTLTQSLRATDILCREQRHNRTLWSQAIECHRPISDEFMRTSPEALCPNPKYVEDTTDEKYSIEDVFFNICGRVDGNLFEKLGYVECITFGKGAVSSNIDTVKEVKRRWGEDVPCNIGKCVARLGLNLGI